MGYLVASTAPQPWRESVARAAQFLTSEWDSLRNPHLLGTLALTLYTLSHERQQPAGEIPVAAVKEILHHEEHPYSGEPHILRQRIEDTLKAEGHRVSEPTWYASPVWRIYRDLVDVWEPDEPTSDMVPGPTAMRLAVKELQVHLAELDDGRAALLPSAPEPTGPVSITVTGWVRVVQYGIGSAASIPVRCEECEAMEGGTLTADGPDATYTCVNGHVLNHHQLTAARVRQALTFCLDPTDTDPRNVSPSFSGTITVEGTFRVASSSMSEDADPLAFIYTPVTYSPRPAAR
ncbi:hypothetical protein AB0H73_36660 [Streptomyces olivoreticuli]